jgi:deoxycytidylate deaminase
MQKVPDKVVVAAVKAASRSNARYHIGAVIFRDREIISTGFNRWLHHGPTEFLPKSNYSIHAEEDSLFGLSRRVTYGASIFVFREGNLLAKPCVNCQKKISKSGITKIYYSPI